MAQIVVFLALFFGFLSLDAKCSATVKARYATQHGWSKAYSVEATFLSGKELNDATSTFDYNILSHYAVIFWEKGQATIIELKASLLCSYEVTCHCLENFVYDKFVGRDQDGDSWKICLEREGYISSCF